MKNNATGYDSQYSENPPTLEQLDRLDGYAVIEFGAPWCGHCQRAEPIVQRVMDDYPELLHIKVYDGKGKALGRAFRVKLWPTLIMWHEGKEVARLVRPTSQNQVRRLLDSIA